MATTRAVWLQLTRVRWLLAALLLVGIASSLLSTQRRVPSATAAPNPYLNAIGSGPELQHANPGDAPRSLMQAQAAPAVTSVSPSRGDLAGGDSLTITGTGFLGATAVTFTDSVNVGVPAEHFRVVNDTTIVGFTPPGRAGDTVHVHVSNGGGTSPLSTADSYTYIDAYPGMPRVTGLSPNSGPPTGGTHILITGTGFLGAAAVTFQEGGPGLDRAASFTVISDKEIQATTPPGPHGDGVLVTVSNRVGASASSPALLFWYAYPCSVALQVSPASPQPLGTQPGLFATTAYCPAVANEFQFTMTDLVGEVWTLQDWSPNSTLLRWPFVLDVPGTYSFSVQVRTTGQTAVLASASTSYTLTNPCPSVQLSLTPAQPTLGTPVSLSATAPGCARPEFQFTLSLPSGTSTTLQSWNANASLAQVFTPRDAGTYSVDVQVRPAGVTSDPTAGARTSFTLSIADAPAPTGLHLITAMRTSVTVAWSSPALSTITAYRVALEDQDPANPGGDTIDLHPSDAGFSSHTATLTGLTPGTDYTVMVAACDAAGACNWSGAIIVSTLAGPPPHCRPGTCT